MKFFKGLGKALHSPAGAYIFFALSAFAFAFLYSADWAWGWIAELYPLGENFVPAALGLCAVSGAVSLAYLIFLAFKGCKGKALHIAVRIIHTVFELLSLVLFIYTFVLLFGLDKGITAEGFAQGFSSLAPNMAVLGFALLCPLPFLFCETGKKAGRAVVAVTVIAGLMLSMTALGKNFIMGDDTKMPTVKLSSENVLAGAQVVFESLRNSEKPDAENLLKDGNGCWTAQDPNRNPAEGCEDANNSYAELKLAKVSSFNTAIIREAGNQAQYFRLQAYIDGEWKTVYQSEKIQSMRICSFDTVTTDRVRLSIDKFRSADEAVKIKSLELYNEPARNAEGFEVTAYQRLDGDVPTEILARGEEYVKNYARFYDVYTTVLVFAAVHWDENGIISFGEGGEEKFASELNALKKIIDCRSNKEHNVKIIVTTLADGAWNGMGGVNAFMEKYWESVAEQTVELAKKYQLDGVDIDWEYPRSSADWDIFNKFITKLDNELKAENPNSVLSGALSAGALGMSKEVLARFDQIQFMAYDGMDEDGYQSSLQQAQEGLQAFVDNGADISKINIGIAAYARPVNNTPYWGIWRDFENGNYWDSKYYNIHDAGQVYDGTFCSPATAGDKTAYALMCGAGGVMVFRVACDKTMDNPNSVACGIENALKRYTVNW